MNITYPGTNNGAQFAMRHLSKILTATLALLLGVMLLATIYFTLFDLQWVAFLLGVLFAGGAALASQNAKAQWLVLRRSAQLKRVRELLADQGARTERANDALKSTEARFRTVCDALSTVVLFVDRNERCRYHNPAFEHWCGRGKDGINGAALRTVVGDSIYHDLQSHGAEALLGKEARYEASWLLPGGENEDMKVTVLPFPPGVAYASGFYVLVDSLPKPIAIPAVGASEPVRRELQTPQDRGRADPVESSTDLARGDPRAHLMRALEQDEFILFAQKIEPISPSVSQTRFQEVLLRLQEENERLLPPGGFFPIAERCNLMGEIDRWVVRNLLKWCASKRREDTHWHSPLYCVNLSRAALLEPRFATYVHDELERSEIPGHRLCFEISAGDVSDHTLDVRRLMDSLKALGCRFSVDGFEGGQGSYARLKTLAFDFLKIDGFTVLNILVDDSELAKVKAIVLTCRQMGLHTIAQFVESEDIRKKLVEIGVDYVQGFSVGKPGPLADIH